MKIRRILCLLLLAVLPLPGVAGGERPASLVITYRARPEARVAFRTWLETRGAAQFAGWRKAGVFAEAKILFGSLAATSTIDAMIILEFAHYTDCARWKEVERTHPGGLSPEALSLAAAESAQFADTISHGAGPGRDPTKAVYLVANYEVPSDMPRYRAYVQGYVAPQMRGWIEEGALAGFTLLANQSPLHHPWDALLVLEYSDLPGLARRDEVKREVRTRLAATDSAWAEWSKDKGELRKELSLFMADAINLPATP